MSNVLVVRIGDWADVGAAATRVRDEVFVAEQGVPRELEHDAADAGYLHALATLDGTPIGTARLKPDGHLGRMAVRQAWRGQGVGAKLLAVLSAAAADRGYRAIVLNAQASAVGFYERFGFISIGERFIEAGIEHQTMRRSLVPAAVGQSDN